MRGLHFDCFSGISGDMTLAALIDAGVDAAAVRAASTRLDCRSVLRRTRSARAASRPRKSPSMRPKNTSIAICPTWKKSSTAAGSPPSQRELALRIFRRLAEAEAAAHGMPLGEGPFP